MACFRQAAAAQGDPQFVVDRAVGVRQTPAASGVSGALLLKGSDMFILIPNGGAYTVEASQKRNP